MSSITGRHNCEQGQPKPQLGGGCTAHHNNETTVGGGEGHHHRVGGGGGGGGEGGVWQPCNIHAIGPASHDHSVGGFRA